MARTAQHATNHAARHATTTPRRTLKQHPAGGEPCESANGNPLQTSPCTSPDADVVGVSPVPVHMWQWCAQSPFRCGRGEPSPGADVAGASPVPWLTWQCRARFLVHLWATGRRPQVVTLNYRVGPLGFGTFRRADGTVDANWGLQDQREALR